MGGILRKKTFEIKDKIGEKNKNDLLLLINRSFCWASLWLYVYFLFSRALPAFDYFGPAFYASSGEKYFFDGFTFHFWNPLFPAQTIKSLVLHSAIHQDFRTDQDQRQVFLRF